MPHRSKESCNDRPDGPDDNAIGAHAGNLVSILFALEQDDQDSEAVVDRWHPCTAKENTWKSG